jgi:hypothetical protein
MVESDLNITQILKSIGWRRRLTTYNETTSWLKSWMGLADLKDGEEFLDFKEHLLELEIAPERTCTLITRMVGLKALCRSPYNHCLSTEEVCANMSGHSSCLSQ